MSPLPGLHVEDVQQSTKDMMKDEDTDGFSPLLDSKDEGMNEGMKKQGMKRQGSMKHGQSPLPDSMMQKGMKLKPGLSQWPDFADEDFADEDMMKRGHSPLPDFADEGMEEGMKSNDEGMLSRVLQKMNMSPLAVGSSSSASPDFTAASPNWKPFTPPSATGVWTNNTLTGEAVRCSPPPRHKRRRLVTPGAFSP